MPDDTTNQDLPWHLVHELSWADCVRLMCAFESWAYDKRMTPQQRHDLLHLSSEMQRLVRALPYMWDPPRKPGRPSVTKFVADQLREYDEGMEGLH